MFLKQDNALDLELQQNGFAVVKNVLTAEEIQELRRALKKHFWKNGIYMMYGIAQPNAAVAIPDLSWLFHHPKILDVVRSALGQNKVVFTSHCDAHIRTLARWHKDDGPHGMPGSYFGRLTYDEPDCKVYKIAVYLQDHSTNRSGMHVRVGSHRSSSLSEGKEVYLATQLGDIVIFDVRTTHRGQLNSSPVRAFKKALNLLQSVAVKSSEFAPDVIGQLLAKIYAQVEQERASIFFTYGLPNEFTRVFAINNMKRQLAQTYEQNPLVSHALRQALLDQNVLLMEDDFASLLENPIK